MEEVLGFMREYINSRYARTAERKAKIREVLRSLTGEKLNESCSTCYIEALFKIKKIMATVNYELKRGYVATFDNGAYKGIKSFTDREITDELAGEYLKQFPSRVIYFVRTAAMPVSSTMPQAQITIIQPPKREPEKEPVIEVIPKPKKPSGKSKK
jgi:hypothetical protein